MSRKRDRANFTRQDRPAPFPKRRRSIPPHPPPPTSDDVKPSAKPPAVMVMGLSPDCSVLDLKSRFAIYGDISRIRIDGDGVGYITYRSKDSAEAAITASLDPSFGINIDSKKLQVLWATDPLAHWREGVGIGSKKDSGPSSSSSKLVRAEIPLSRHGRGNKLASAVVNPRSNGSSSTTSTNSSSALDVPFKGREIIAYDDIL